VQTRTNRSILNHHDGKKNSHHTSSSSNSLGAGSVNNGGDFGSGRCRGSPIGRGCIGSSSSKSRDVDDLHGSEKLRGAVGLALGGVADDGEGELGNGCGIGEGQTVSGISSGLEISTVEGSIGGVEDTTLVSMDH
jgi:hypothetical protein